ncbi:MAG: hypothetical protein ACTSYX_04855 [Candidatus Thorarchaeota archaeon]
MERTIERTYYPFYEKGLGNYYKVVFEVRNNTLSVSISCVGYAPPGCSEGWNDWGKETLTSDVVSTLEGMNDDEAFDYLCDILDELGWNVDVLRGDDE